MPQRFHFDLTNEHTVVCDEKGVLADDLHEAIEEALEALREMRISGDIDELGYGWKMLIRDTEGVVRKILTVW
ncbi:DUF6894 family protein [Methylobacterium nigriterrae]|uniref:DUF6894 family protein n=1 Tax=Methylobacterium nigriterrae TaxID=3127512 RepID=UPI003014011F